MASASDRGKAKERLMLAQGSGASARSRTAGLQCIIAAFAAYSNMANLLTKRELYNKNKRQFWSVTVAALVFAIVLPLAAESAKSLYNKGRDAEARGDMEAAYEFYKLAYEHNPKELSYRASFNRTRFESAAKKVSRGQMLREQGQYDAALAEFQKAADVDSSSAIARQEIKRTQEIIQKLQNPQPPQSQA